MGVQLSNGDGWIRHVSHITPQAGMPSAMRGRADAEDRRSGKQWFPLLGYYWSVISLFLHIDHKRFPKYLFHLIHEFIILFTIIQKFPNWLWGNTKLFLTSFRTLSDDRSNKEEVRTMRRARQATKDAASGSTIFHAIISKFQPFLHSSRASLSPSRSRGCCARYALLTECTPRSAKYVQQFHCVRS